MNIQTEAQLAKFWFKHFLTAESPEGITIIDSGMVSETAWAMLAIDNKTGEAKVQQYSFTTKRGKAAAQMFVKFFDSEDMALYLYDNVQRSGGFIAFGDEFIVTPKGPEFVRTH